MKTFGRFGNMNPPRELSEHPYRLAVEPFCIKGNTYFVGNAQSSTILIDSGAGLVLLDVPCEQELAFTVNNIWKAGFDPADVELIIVSHAHPDHYGSVEAMRVVCPNAEVALGHVDAEDMARRPGFFEEYVKEFGPYNENFIPDRTLEDGEVVELGDVRIACRNIPGHTIGAQAHFWETQADGRTYRFGIYGGAGFLTMQEALIKKNQWPMSIREDFAASIEKVWDERVDIMLGNHPFHSDTWKKRLAYLQGDKDAFVDPGEWHRFLTELREGYRFFLGLTPEQQSAQMMETRFECYTGQYLTQIDELLKNGR